MLTLIIIGGGFAVSALVWSFEEHSREQEEDMLVREELKKRGIEVNWNKRLNWADFKSIVKGM